MLGSTIVQNTDGTASLVHPIYGPVHNVSGPNAAALLQQTYPSATVSGASAPTTSGAATTPTAAQVTDAYERILGRAPDPGGLAHYTSPAGARTESGLTGIEAVKEHLEYAKAADLAARAAAAARQPQPQSQSQSQPQPNREDAITALYERIFNRSPDEAGLAYYLTGGGKDLPLSEVERLFKASPELNPASANPVAARRSGLNELYRTVLGRDPDTPGLDYYLSGAGKELPLSRVSELLRDSSEFKERFPRFDVTKSGLFPTQFTFPTEPQPQEILGITGRPTTPRGIANLYQRFLGREPDLAGLQFYTQKFGPTMTPQGVSDFIGDIYGPSGEVATRGGVLPEAAFRGPAVPSQAPTLSYGSQQVSPFGFVTPTAPGTTAVAPAPVGGQAGGLVAYKEGGMPKLSAKDAGSQFNMSEFLDKEGRLVGGFSKPIRDQYGNVTGYDFQPYQSNVVFNPELRKAEARGMSPEERAAALREMLFRQGLTGISPTRGGLPGIIPREPTMRERPRYYSYAEGGLASLAENLADKGRGGDSMLVHMSPEEVQGINALTQRMTGRSLTINPQTGLPEAFLAAFLPALLGLGGTKLLGLTALQSALLVGAGYAAKYGSLKRGIMAGLGAFGGAQMGAGLEAAGAAAPAAKATELAGQQAAAAQAGAGAVSSAYGGVPLGSVTEVVGPSVGGGLSPYADISRMPLKFTETGALPIPQASGLQASIPTSGMTATTPVIDQIAKIPTTVPPSGTALERMTKGASDLMSSDKAVREAAQAAYKVPTDSTPFMAVSQILGGAGAESAIKEQDKFKAEQAVIARKKEEEEEDFLKLFRRSLGRVSAADGGLVAMAGGGMPTFEYGGTTAPTGEPRMVQGAGDGMSDNIPANIEGVQEARLANDEFVVPADVVADIGNGSSSAGAKKLYAMMDRIRKARHGTTEQPPEIDAERLMPA